MITITEAEYTALLAAANAADDRRERSGRLLSEALDALVTAIHAALDDCPKGVTDAELIDYAISIASACTDETLALYVTDNYELLKIAEEILTLARRSRMRGEERAA